MSITINHQTTHKKVAVESSKTQKQQDITKQTNAPEKHSKDSVQLTSQALNLNKTQELTTEPQVNTKRIASLKAAILNGDYKIDTDRLAEKLSKFEGDFSKAFG